MLRAPVLRCCCCCCIRVKLSLPDCCTVHSYHSVLICTLRRLCSTIACLTSLARGAIVDQDRPALDLKRRLSYVFDTMLRLHKSIGQCDSCIVFAGNVFIGIGSIKELPRKIPFAQTSDVGTRATMMDPTQISFRRRVNVAESSRQRRTRAVDSMSKEALHGRWESRMSMPSDVAWLNPTHVTTLISQDFEV